MCPIFWGQSQEGKKVPSGLPLTILLETLKPSDLVGSKCRCTFISHEGTFFVPKETKQQPHIVGLPETNTWVLKIGRTFAAGFLLVSS